MKISDFIKIAKGINDGFFFYFLIILGQDLPAEVLTQIYYRI
jgi:hypothetical protein